MRALLQATLLVTLGGCCWPGSSPPEIEPLEPAKVEVVEVVEVAPVPVVAPAPPAPAVTKPAPTTRPTPKKRVVKPRPAAKGTVTVLGDAKTVWLLGDSTEDKYENGGEVDAGNYKVKAWYQNDPVPEVAMSVFVEANTTVTITCSSSGKWCKKGTHEFGSLDTGR